MPDLLGTFSNIQSHASSPESWDPFVASTLLYKVTTGVRMLQISDLHVGRLPHDHFEKLQGVPSRLFFARVLDFVQLRSNFGTRRLVIVAEVGEGISRT